MTTSLTAAQLDELEDYLGFVSAEWIDSRWGQIPEAPVLHLRASVLRELLVLGRRELYAQASVGVNAADSLALAKWLLERHGLGEIAAQVPA